MSYSGWRPVPGLVLTTIVLIGLAGRAVAVAVPLHDGLAAYWALDEGLGSVAHDWAPGDAVSDDGSLRNSPAWIDGIFGAGLAFNGQDQDVLIPSSADLDIGGAAAVTLSAWVKLNELPSEIPGSFSGIFDSATDNYILYLDKGNNELRFKVTTTTGGAARPGVPASMLNKSEWNHLMGVYGGDGHASIYFNGELAGDIAASGLLADVKPGQVAGIGSQVSSNAPYASSSHFNGGIADVAVWGRALGLAEAQYLYNEGVGNAVGAANPSIEPVAPPRPDNPSILIEAHRGYSAIAPENTLAAFKAAAGIADYVELDVRVTQDNQLVVMHDATLDRTTNGTGAVGARNYTGYIDGLDAGGWFSPDFAGEGVPTLGEAVETILAHDMRPLIERKTGDAADIVQVLDGLGVLQQSVIISFDWNFLTDVRQLDSAVKLGGLGSGSLGSGTVANAIAAGFDFLDWGDSAAITSAAVDMVHAAGLELHVWTVDNLTRMQQLIDLGVDGITTNTPESLRSIVPFAGDFNNDGVVDAADYTAWRDADSDADDYKAWVENYGRGSVGGSPESPAPPSSAPAPSSVWSLTSLAVLWVSNRRRWRLLRVSAEGPP
ncbi:Glycerophosphoryl diester phosphodiesterase [Posidoniimonas polymericola]|uniref:Glycerophosphoryl diester phosphodiesterase n=1 Tax=Posidoniimonas polymericola TaxID=2528002 RepID=A0A5C5YTM0_9BACT|nr:glycerophosphodiester phosphodiesterase family protein [Posidoniimonas polymericola]TWT78325.1 Glycerophosphoryl diester phosphodiesterase [Posidoniimonas polymericola]